MPDDPVVLDTDDHPVGALGSHTSVAMVGNRQIVRHAVKVFRQRRREQHGRGRRRQKQSCGCDMTNQTSGIYRGCAPQWLQRFAIVQIGPSRARRADGLCDRGIEQLARLHGVVDAQTQMQPHIGFHFGADLAERVLRAGDQMHTQRPAQ